MGLSGVIKDFKSGLFTVTRAPSGSYVNGVYQKGGYPLDGKSLAAMMGRSMSPTSYWHFDQGGPDEPAIALDLAGDAHLSPRQVFPEPSPTQGVFVPSLASKTVEFAASDDGYLSIADPAALDVGDESLAVLWVGVIHEVLVGNHGIFGKRTSSAGYYVRVAESGVLDWNCESPTGMVSEQVNYSDAIGKPVGFLFLHDRANDLTKVYRWLQGEVIDGGASPASIGSMTNDSFFRLGNFIFTAAHANVSAFGLFKGAAAEGLTGTHLANLMGTVLSGNPITFQAEMSIQPVTGRNLKLLPEGQYAEESRVIFTETELRTRTHSNDPDLVEIDGESWKVFNVQKWPSFYKAMVGRVV